MIFNRLFLASALVLIFSFGGIHAMHGEGSLRRPDREELSGTKAFIAAGVGGMIGFIGGELYKRTTKLGGLYGAALCLYGLSLLRKNRTETVNELVGPKYVGISGLAALVTALVVTR